MKSITVKQLGYLGLLGSILVGIGEFLLHYSTQVLGGGEQFVFFTYVSENHLLYGHYLAVIGLPFYFAGYLHIYKMLVNGHKSLASTVLFLGFTAFAVGGIWIGSRGFLGTIVHLKEDILPTIYQKIIDNYSLYLENLVQILRIVILLLSVLFAFTVLKYKTSYPKIMALFNPMVILLIFVLIGFTIPLIGKYILPILMNITHFVFFSLSIYYSTKLNKS